jgi:hypothetical protein
VAEATPMKDGLNLANRSGCNSIIAEGDSWLLMLAMGRIHGGESQLCYHMADCVDFFFCDKYFGYN